MNKKSITLKIDNQNLPYIYNGEASINKEIIEFIDNDEEYIYDMKINRLTKIKNGYKIVIDFDQELIKLYDEKENCLDIKIKIKKKEIKENNINIIYIVDKNEICFELEVE